MSTKSLTSKNILYLVVEVGSYIKVETSVLHIGEQEISLEQNRCCLVVQLP